MRDFWCGNCGAHLTRETEDAHRCAATVPTSPTDTGDNGLRAASITATMIERLAKSKYERFDSHFSMPGGLSWDEYLLDDPAGALMYINDASDDLNAALTEDGAE